MIIDILKKQKKNLKIENISKKTGIKVDRINNLLRKSHLYKETKEEAQAILEYLLTVQEDNEIMIQDGILHYNEK